MSKPLLAGILLASVAVSGCATVDPFEGSIAPERETFYSAVAGLAVHEKASGSSKVVGRLALHERVTRTKIESGWARVEAEPGGLAGWVDDAKLVPRLPTSHGAAPHATEAAHPGSPPPAEAAVTPASVVTPAAAVEPEPDPAPATDPPSPPPPPPPPAEKPRSEPAVFDPF